MADSHPLAGLLDRAGHTFTLADQLGRAFQEEYDRQGHGHRIVDPTAWSRHEAGFSTFSAAVLDLREEMQNPPNGFAPVAQVLLEAARLAKQVRDTMQTNEGRMWQSFLDFRFHFNTIFANGNEAVRTAKNALRTADPFAFLDSPPKKHTGPVCITPAMPKPPANLVEAAERAIPVILADIPVDAFGQIQLDTAAHLVARMQKAGHTLAASQWAILESVMARRLETAAVEVGFPSFKTDSGWEGGGRGVRAFPKDKPAPFDCFKVFPTAAMSEWWRSWDTSGSGPAREPDGSRGRSGKAQVSEASPADRSGAADTSTPGNLSEAINAFIAAFEEFWELRSEPGISWIGGDSPDIETEADRVRASNERSLQKLAEQRGTELVRLLAGHGHKAESIAVLALLEGFDKSENLSSKWNKLGPELKHVAIVEELHAQRSARQYPAGDTIEHAIRHLLTQVPTSWTEYDDASLNALQERALYLLTAAGMIERRATLRLRMFGHPVAVEATIALTGEGGFAEAMEYVVADMWTVWREGFETRNKSETNNSPGFFCELIGMERWRLTTEGIEARNDLSGNSQSSQSTVFDFVLKRGFFDGQARRMPNGRISQRLPVRGAGKLERMQRVQADANPTGVSITNWDVGSQAFAAAFAQLLKGKAAQAPAKPADAAPKAKRGTQPKRSSSKGEAVAKLTAALLKHHGYEDGSCVNPEPSNNNGLAKAAGVSKSSASAFFEKKFGGYEKYRVLCRDSGRLGMALKLLNGDYSPRDLYGRRPANEDDRDEADA